MTLGLLLTAGLWAQTGNNGLHTPPAKGDAKGITFPASDIQFWTGTGTNQAVYILAWDDDPSGNNLALAWGVRWNGTATATQLLDTIVAYDSRFSYTLSGALMTDMSYNDGTVNPQSSMNGWCYYYNGNWGMYAWPNQPMSNGDVIEMSSSCMWTMTSATAATDPSASSTTDTVDATIDTAAIQYWVGNGSNRAVLIVNWGNPDTALAWGFRFNGTVTAQTMVDSIAAADPRFWTVGSPSLNGDIHYRLDNGDTLGLIPASATSEGFNFWWANLNGLNASGGAGESLHDGDVFKYGDYSIGIGWDPLGTYYLERAWLKTPTPVPAPSPADTTTTDTTTTDTTVVAVDATIDTADIQYWIGHGSNALTFVVNWADTALAWGYRFGSDSVKLNTVMNDIAAVDPRFSYTGTGMVSDINFIANGDTLGITPGNWWNHYLNGETSAGMNQWMHNGDLSRWADPAAGVLIDSVYHEEWDGWMEYIYAYPQTITPVSKILTIDNIQPEDIKFWVGEGNKEIIFVVSWPDSTLAWGYRYSIDPSDLDFRNNYTFRDGDTLVSINHIEEEIERTDPRFFSRWPQGGGSNPPRANYENTVLTLKIPDGNLIGIDPPYPPRVDRKDGSNAARYGLFFVENGDTLSGSEWHVKVNGLDPYFRFYDRPLGGTKVHYNPNAAEYYATEGSIVHIFDTSTIDSIWHDWFSGQEVYSFTQEITPATPAFDATISEDEIRYWVGEGDNKLIFAVNWAGKARAWGYRFADDSVTLATVMNDIAAADYRFSYSGEGMVNDIMFVEDGDTLRGTPGSWWEHSLNGISSAGLSQWMHNGDFSRWADPVAGVVKDSIYYDGWGWVYTYIYPQTIYPVEEPYAPFCGPVDEDSECAIALNDSRISGWATGCTVVRGSSNLSDPDAAAVTYGEESAGVGPASTSTLEAVSLGDGGSATLTFATPITNVDGFDFAVFENSFDDYFLELAFVEVSSDGEHFVRFPATSLTQTHVQIGGTGRVNATYINNLAGKFRVGYGTPFDLEELRDSANIDINNITHVRVIDVVGSIDPQYGSYDAFGHLINDPFPTPSYSAGFDLEGVCVLGNRQGINQAEGMELKLYPNPARGMVNMTLKAEAAGKVSVFDMTGREVMSSPVQAGNSTVRFNTESLPDGVYMVKFGSHVEKLVVRH